MSQGAGARRELTAAVVAAVVAGGLALIAGGQSWAQVTLARAAPLPPVQSTLSGAEAVPLVPAAGLVLLAAAVALLAVRGFGRVVTGLLVALAGGTLAWSGLRALLGGVRVDDAGGSAGEVVVDASAAWPVLAVAAGVLGVAAGVLVVLRGRAWPGMGRRYERTGTTGSTTAPRTAEDRAQDAWKALDRGEDPTASAPPPGRAGPAPHLE